jgi:1,4-dihydroxy-6-naphthoate synthase
MGMRYGPRLVARQPMTISEIKGKRIAIPGPLTTAYLALKLVEPDFTPVQMPFDTIEQAVATGSVELGLLIHEGQLTFQDSGLHLVLDLGEWWFGETGLPLPLGGNVVRKDMGEATIRTVSRHLHASIAYSLEHREAALRHSMQFARGLDERKADEFVGMYVNELTLDYGDDGRRAVQLLLDRGFERGLIPNKVSVEFARD